jgi:hypothetical protein
MAIEIKEQTNIETQKQLLKTADLRISHLQSSTAKTQEKLSELQTEKSLREQITHERHVKLALVRQELELLQEKQRLSRIALDLAEGTPLEAQKSEEWHQAVFAYNTAAADLDTLVEASQKSDGLDDRELQQINRNILKQQSLLKMEQEHLATFQQARLQVHQELDAALREDFTQRLEQEHEIVASLALQLAAAQESLDGLSRMALEEVQPGIETESHIKPLCTYSDETTKIIEAAIAYRKALATIEDIFRFVDRNALNVSWLQCDPLNMPAGVRSFNQDTDTLVTFLEHYRAEKLQ